MGSRARAGSEARPGSERRRPVAGRRSAARSAAGSVTASAPGHGLGRRKRTDIRIERSADRSVRPFPWPQRKSFTPEALYVVCHELDYKKKFMSSPARAEGYDSPAQQREDSRTFMTVKVVPSTGQNTVLPAYSGLRPPFTTEERIRSGGSSRPHGRRRARAGPAASGRARDLSRRHACLAQVPEAAAALSLRLRVSCRGGSCAHQSDHLEWGRGCTRRGGGARLGRRRRQLRRSRAPGSRPRESRGRKLKGPVGLGFLPASESSCPPPAPSDFPAACGARLPGGVRLREGGVGEGVGGGVGGDSRPGLLGDKSRHEKPRAAVGARARPKPVMICITSNDIIYIYIYIYILLNISNIYRFRRAVQPSIQAAK